MDYYRLRIKHAAWTWREDKVCRYHNHARRKDRTSGRADKRAARLEARAELVAELVEFQHHDLE